MMAKPVVVADEQLRHPEPRSHDDVDEPIGRIRRKCVREWQKREVVDARFGENLELLFRCCEELRSCRWIYNLERMRIEAHHETRQPRRSSCSNKARDDVEVTSMNSIERAHRNDG